MNLDRRTMDVLGKALLREEEPEPTAWDREETEPCERGTVGCSVQHTGDTDCATW